MSQFMLIILVLLPILVESKGNWSYENVKEWSRADHYCGGNQQSPIALRFNISHYDNGLRHMYFVEHTRDELHIVNNGHSVELNLRNKYVLKHVAPQSEDYIVEQVHFHWGHAIDNTTGSEHSLEDRFYPLEMHVVTYSNWYSNIGDAVKNTRALAVVGAFFEVSNESNSFLQPIIDALKHIHHPNGRKNVSNDFDLISLLGENRMGRYYRYDGSLTTPHCFESVIWSVLQEPLPISYDQLQAFQSLHDAKKKPLINTYRSIQPMGTRKLFRSFHSQNIHDNNLKERKTSKGHHDQYVSNNIKIVFFFLSFSMINV